ncbi:MAG TPA: ABC transporter permease [Limnochordia bacterium]
MPGLRRYVVKKVGWYLAALLVALSLNFLLPRLVPGNPVSVIISQMGQMGGAQSDAMEKMYRTFMAEFGLDQPLWRQYLHYVSSVLQGDLGTSFTLYPAPVLALIAQALPWSVALQVPAILCGWLIGNALGAVSAYRGGRFDAAAFTGALALSNIPYYCLAILLLYLLAVKWEVFPVAGGYSFGSVPSLSWHFLVDALRHYALPFLSLVLVAIGGQAIGMREMAIYELQTDYVAYAKGLGVPDRRVVGYVFRNAMLPQVTGLAIAFGTMVGGALITETVFSYPGIGSLLFQAIRQNDYPLIQGITWIITLAVLVANFLVDIAYGLIDPRIRAAQVGER